MMEVQRTVLDGIRLYAPFDDVDKLSTIIDRYMLSSSSGEEVIQNDDVVEPEQNFHKPLGTNSPTVGEIIDLIEGIRDKLSGIRLLLDELLIEMRENSYHIPKGRE